MVIEMLITVRGGNVNIYRYKQCKFGECHSNMYAITIVSDVGGLYISNDTVQLSMIL